MSVRALRSRTLRSQLHGLGETRQAARKMDLDVRRQMHLFVASADGREVGGVTSAYEAVRIQVRKSSRASYVKIATSTLDPCQLPHRLLLPIRMACTACTTACLADFLGTRAS